MQWANMHEKIRMAAKKMEKRFCFKKNILLLTSLSLIACGLHAVMLYTPINQYAYTSVAKVVLFVLCPIIYFAAKKCGKLKDLLFIRGERKYIRISLFLGIGVFALILAVGFAISPLLDRSLIIVAMSNVGITGENYFLALAYYLLINVALEELFFRGFLFASLYRMNVKRYAHIYSSLLFAAYHISVMRDGATLWIVALAVVGLALVGLFFNEITRRCGNAIGSYTIHVGASLAIGLIGAYYMYFD